MSQHRKAFDEFFQRVQDELGDKVDQIVLFGSVARNEETENSDIDVLVVVEDKSLKDRIFDISYSIMLETDIYISPKVVDIEEFEQIQDTSFMKEIEEEMQVYGAA
jgi:predicted nucleotidyltransferase